MKKEIIFKITTHDIPGNSLVEDDSIVINNLFNKFSNIFTGYSKLEISVNTLK